MTTHTHAHRPPHPHTHIHPPAPPQVPALALWIQSPLLSLIDSASVGQAGGKLAAMRLAALGPGTTLIDGSAYLFASTV